MRKSALILFLASRFVFLGDRCVWYVSLLGARHQNVMTSLIAEIWNSVLRRLALCSVLVAFDANGANLMATLTFYVYL